MSAEALIEKLINAGTPAALVAEVAMELGRAQAATELLNQRRAKDRERKRLPRKSVESTEDAEILPVSPKVSPKDNIKPPSSPPVDVSEADASSHQPRPWALLPGVSLQVWEDLMTNRRKKRLPNTDTAWKKFLTDLSETSAATGIPPPKLVEQCTAKGWGAIYDPREERNGRTAIGKTAATFALLSGGRDEPF